MLPSAQLRSTSENSQLEFSSILEQYIVAILFNLRFLDFGLDNLVIKFTALGYLEAQTPIEVQSWQLIDFLIQLSELLAKLIVNQKINFQWNKLVIIAFLIWLGHLEAQTPKGVQSWRRQCNIETKGFLEFSCYQESIPNSHKIYCSTRKLTSIRINSSFTFLIRSVGSFGSSSPQRSIVLVQRRKQGNKVILDFS